MHQHGILHHVPVVGGQHVLAALVQDGVEGVAGDVERHGVGAGIQVHLVEVLEVIEIGHDPAGGGVVLEVIKHPVHLVHLPLGVDVLDAQLIAVGFADGTGLVGPLVPDMGVEIMDVVGFFLPDPQQFVHRGFPIGPPESENGELLLEIVAVDNAEFLNGMGGGAVVPVGTDILVGIPHAGVQNLPAGADEKRVGLAHTLPPLAVFSPSIAKSAGKDKQF